MFRALVPLKTADLDRLAAVLAQAEALAKGRDPAADDTALAQFGDVDPVNWSVEAVRALGALEREDAARIASSATSQQEL